MSRYIFILFLAILITVNFVAAESPEMASRVYDNIPPSAGFTINISNLNLEGDWKYCILKVDSQDNLEEIKEEYITAKQDCSSPDDFSGKFQEVKAVSERCKVYESYANISLNHTMNFDSYWEYNKKSGIDSKFCISLGYAKIINFVLKEEEAQENFIFVLENVGTEEVYFSDILEIPLNDVIFIGGGNHKTYDLPTKRLELKDNHEFNVKFNKVDFNDTEKPGFFKRISNWFKCLFSRNC